MLNIIYRMCESDLGKPTNHRPIWFSKKNCLFSFLNALEISKHLVDNVIFIHDGEEGELFSIISTLDFKIIKTNFKSNFGTLSHAYTIAKDLIGDLYFIEDDYLHLPTSILKIAETVKELNLVTGYDHPHRYFGTDDLFYELEIKFLNYHHWRTSESTCHTFAISENTFKSNYNLITSFDCVNNDRFLFRSLYQHKIPLWVPIPGLITQVDPYLSPGIAWDEFNSTVL